MDVADSPDGKRHQTRKGGFPNKTSAAEALRELQRQMANGQQVGTKLTVGTYLKDWLLSRETAGRRISTLAQYRDHIDRFLVPAFGQVRLTDLRASHVDALMKTMADERRGLPSMHRVLATLSSALGTAEKRRLVSTNVCRQVEIAPERTPVRPVYDAKQLSKFLAYVDQDRLAALWRLYAVIGLRRGEALALTWSTVNFRDSTVRIECAVGVVDGRLVWGPPKSDSGTRTVALDGETLRILKSHRAAQSAERLALGSAYRDQDLVFAHEDGTTLRPEWVSKHFHVLSDAAGLPRIHLHDLRHSAASMALSAGVPMKVVSENLGHSTLAVTANTYSHVTSELARESAEKVAAALAAQ